MTKPPSVVERLRTRVRDVPDFPKPGIVFKDITPLLQDAAALELAIAELARPFRDEPIDRVVGIESRGFIFGAPVALALGAGLSLARKSGKLPWEIKSRSYTLEYGTEVIEMHRDTISPGQRVLIVDDVIATGGTARATAELVESMGGEVAGLAFLIELGFLEGRAKLETREIRSVLLY